jgi:hypothetical protein
MELYFTARCFREFSRVRGNFPKDPPKYIIAYFGNEHIKKIKNILENPPFNAKLEKSIDFIVQWGISV